MSEEKGDNWEMPKPIFRRSSGSLPKEFAKKIERSNRPAPETNADAPDDILASLYAPPDDPVVEPPVVPAITPTVDIEPQPSITEQFTVEEAPCEPAEEVKRNRGFFGKIFLVLGVLIMLAAAVGIIVLIYYLFFCEQECRQWFYQFYSPK